MFAVAIDGPSGVGKSSISKKLAQELGFMYVDTGAIYRTLALYLIENNVDLRNKEEVCKKITGAKVEIEHTDDGQRMFLCGEDVTDKLRTEIVSQSASKISVISDVREYLLSLQTEIAEKNNVVMDGRDIGSVVLPNAQVKIFLTASANERANRRVNQLKKRGIEAEYEEVLKDIEERDFRDKNREIAPLKPTEDAIIIDSTENTKDKTVGILLKIIREKLSDYN